VTKEREYCVTGLLRRTTTNLCFDSHFSGCSSFVVCLSITSWSGKLLRKSVVPCEETDGRTDGQTDRQTRQILKSIL